MLRSRYFLAVILLLLLLILWRSTSPPQSPLRPIPNSEKVGKVGARPVTEITDETVQSQLQLALQQLLVKLSELPGDDKMAAVEPAFAELARESGAAAEKDKARAAPPTLREQFLNAGISVGVFDLLQRHVARNQQSLRELREQALLEGWLDSPEYLKKSNISGDPTRGIREAFGDYVFDLYLFFTHRPNRVQLKTIAAGSVAASAGLVAGDIIIRYGSENIYSAFGLRRAFVREEATEMVLLEFLRDGKMLGTSLPGGAFEASLQMIRLDPVN
jgi:hypothetical protein